MRVLIECKGARESFTLREGITVIGRDRTCDICFPEHSLSRRHVECETHGDDLVVRDLNTKNGTFLGQQRIREARLTPGMRLRAGNVWLRFTSEDAETGVLSPAPRSATDESGPISSDDEPTPADEGVARALASTSGDAGRLIRHGDRWYVVDPGSGKEVEVVPEQPASSAVPVPAREGTAARLARAEAATDGRARRRRLLLILGGIAALLLVVIAGLILMSPPKPVGPPPVTLAEYRGAIAQAISEFRGGKSADAVETLKRLQARPLDRRQTLARDLTAAIAADQAMGEDFRAHCSAADRAWTTVRDSSEVKSIREAEELAKTRLAWLTGEKVNMAQAEEARLAYGKGDYIRAMEYAAAVKLDSMFAAEVKDIPAKAADALVKSAEGRVVQRDWNEIIRALQELIRLRPEMAGQLRPKIALYQQYEMQRQGLEAAQQMLAEGKYDQLIAKLDEIGPDSPYARDAAALRAAAQKKGGVQLAIAAYNAKDGPRALQYLKDAGSPDPALEAKISAVIAAFDEGTAAIKQGKLAAATDAFQRLLRLESPKDNTYAREAKGYLDRMPDMTRELATLLVEEGEAAEFRRDFAVARQKFDEALRMDTTNRDAADGLVRMVKGAVNDYNLAFGFVRDKPEAALKLFKEVLDRLPTTHQFYRPTEVEIIKLEARLKTTDAPK